MLAPPTAKSGSARQTATLKRFCPKKNPPYSMKRAPSSKPLSSTATFFLKTPRASWDQLGSAEGAGRRREIQELLRLQLREPDARLLTFVLNRRKFIRGTFQFRSFQKTA